jgi:hypothetical protein
LCWADFFSTGSTDTTKYAKVTAEAKQRPLQTAGCISGLNAYSDETTAVKTKQTENNFKQKKFHSK